MVEFHVANVAVAGSNPVSRSGLALSVFLGCTQPIEADRMQLRKIAHSAEEKLKLSGFDNFKKINPAFLYQDMTFTHNRVL